MIEVQSVVQKEFNPTRKQTDFIQIPFSVKEALYGGAAGAGKTELIVWLPLIYQFYEHPLYKGIILRRSKTQLDTELISRSKEIYPSLGAVFNEQKKVWTFPSGAKQFFGGADKEDDIRKFDSDQYNLICYDEATHFTEFQYSYLAMSRCRSRTADLPAIIRSGTNPGNVGHAYFKQRFVKPDKNGYKLLVDSKTGLKRIFIPAKINDNEHLLKANPEYVQQLMSLPEAEKKAKLYGDWDTYEGQVFKEFRLEPLSDEPDNARHVIDPFLIPDWWPKFIAIDWGYAAYTCIYWAALSPSGRVFIYREYAERNKQTVDWIADLVRETPDNEKSNIRRIRICHSANQHRGEPFTIIEQLQKKLRQQDYKCPIELGEKNRLNGKMLIHEFLRWMPKENAAKVYSGEYNEEFAQEVFRMHGSKAYEQYLNLFTVNKVEDNIPKLQIFNNCQLLPEAISSCVYEDSPEEGKKAEDVKEFDGDDPYDTLRILLACIKDHEVLNAKELESVHQTEEAIKQMANGDATSFYRRMEHIESKKKQEKGFPVRRRSFSRIGGRMRRM